MVSCYMRVLFILMCCPLDVGMTEAFIMQNLWCDSNVLHVKQESLRV